MATSSAEASFAGGLARHIQATPPDADIEDKAAITAVNAKNSFYAMTAIIPFFYRNEYAKEHSRPMNTTKQLFDTPPRPTLRLSEVERLIRIHRIVVPPISRRRLYEMCESGELECAAALGTGRKRHLVFEDSFLEWVRRLGEGNKKD